MAAPHTPESLAAAKAAMRREAALGRETAGASEGPTGGASRPGALTALLFRFLAARTERVIAGFWPLPGEPDLRKLLEKLAGAGFEVLLPAVERQAAPLVFRAWAPGDALLPGPHGTRMPPPGPARLPELILVPLLAFDRACRRLGRGGGYYDRTLASMPGVPAIGVAHEAAERDEIPAGPLDQVLDAVVTPRAIILRTGA